MINVLLRRGQSVGGKALPLLFPATRTSYLLFDSVTTSVMELFINLIRLRSQNNNNNNNMGLQLHTPSLLKMHSIIDLAAVTPVQKYSSFSSDKCKVSDSRVCVDIRMMTRKGRGLRRLPANTVCASLCILHERSPSLLRVNKPVAVPVFDSIHPCACVHVCA